MGTFIPHSSWMRDIPDDTLLTELSIPGTHNSGCIDGFFGFAQTQNLDLPAQLKAGIRFFDIRFSHYRDNLFLHHNIVYMDKSYADVLAIYSDFLTQHPSETILMSVKEEGRFDDTLGKLAPSALFRKLCSGEFGSRHENTRSFEETFKARSREHLKDASRFYNFTPCPAGDSATDPPALAETTAGEARGKIVLLRRFEGSSETGFDLTYWPENKSFKSADPPIYHVEDHYLDPGDDDKYTLIIAHIDEARRGNREDLYLTFSSAVDLQADGYSKTINPRLNDYLARSPQGRVGIIAVDYFEECPELVGNVIKTNRLEPAEVNARTARMQRESG